MSDELEIVQKAQNGDMEAISYLFSRYWRAARATALSLVGYVAEAEDVTAEAFQSAFAGLKSLRNPELFGPWLRKIVVRTAWSHKARNAGRNETQLQDRPDPTGWPPGVQLEKRELSVLLQEAIVSLPTVYSEAVLLFHYEGYGIEEAIRFLDVPAGTFKRRLHQGRNRLKAAAEKILAGRKPSDQKRDRLMKKIRDMVKNWDDHEAFFQAMKQALQLRPVPHELIRQMLDQRSAATGMSTPEKKAETQRFLSETLSRLSQPSARALDPGHPVGAIAAAIRASLPEFQEWQPPLSQEVQFLLDRNAPPPMPPGFAEGRPGSFLHLTRTILLQNPDGSVETMVQAHQSSETLQTLARRLHEVTRSSDALDLCWLVSGNLGLREVQSLLGKLARDIVPQASTRFMRYQDPGYRSAIRLRLNDNPVPAAIGGVVSNSPVLPSGVEMGQIQILLEPWAAVRSGTAIELAELPPFQVALQDSEVTERKNGGGT